MQGDGGGRRDRTDDLLLAKQALSQLSYVPDVLVTTVNLRRYLTRRQRPCLAKAISSCARWADAINGSASIVRR